MTEARRFVRPALWTAAVLLGGGALFALVLAAEIPYAKTDPPPPTVVAALSSPAPEPVSPWATFSADAIGIRDGKDDRTLLVQAEIPAKAPDCAKDPRISAVTEENGVVHATVTYSGMPAAHVQSGFCQEKTLVELTLTTAAPIGGRTVSFGLAPGKPWKKLANGTWGHCGPLGCDPPADHCAPVRIAQTDGEAVYTKTLACTPDWLVVDRLNSHGGSAIRVIYRWRGEGWESVTGVHTGGCADILAKVPQFPVTLCEKLGTPS